MKIDPRVHSNCSEWDDPVEDVREPALVREVRRELQKE